MWKVYNQKKRSFSKIQGPDTFNLKIPNSFRGAEGYLLKGLWGEISEGHFRRWKNLKGTGGSFWQAVSGFEGCLMWFGKVQIKHNWWWEADKTELLSWLFGFQSAHWQVGVGTAPCTWGGLHPHVSPTNIFLFQLAVSGVSCGEVRFFGLTVTCNGRDFRLGAELMFTQEADLKTTDKNLVIYIIFT